MIRPDSPDEMWAAFLATLPKAAASAASHSIWHFCDNQPAAERLAELVVAGRKRATAGALWSYELEREPVPRTGDYSVITDWQGRARCVVRTTSVEIVPFEAVTREFAATEGEGDGSLEYWRDAHWAYFTHELLGTGRTPKRDMPVVCERFEVVFGARSAEDDEIAIRTAVPDDAARIVAIHQAAVNAERGRGDYDDGRIEAWAHAQTPAELRERIGSRRFLIAEGPTGPIAYAQLDVDKAVVRSIYVDPHNQRRGVGRRLGQAVLEAARDAGLRRLELDSSLNAVPFYEALGFELLGSVAHRLRSGAIMPCRRMARQLEEAK